jgi:hypothetical protein
VLRRLTAFLRSGRAGSTSVRPVNELRAGNE